jgi:hypothetical protein
MHLILIQILQQLIQFYVKGCIYLRRNSINTDIEQVFFFLKISKVSFFLNFFQGIKLYH